MEKKLRRSFSKEFKTNAVKLILEQGRKTSEVARQLDISKIPGSTFRTMSVNCCY